MRRGETRTGGARWSGAKGCAIAVVVLGTILALFGGWALTLRPLHQAVEVREVLAELYGPQDGFTPSASGVVPAERMEVFLGVRERLAESCARLSESSAAIDYVEDFEWVEQPPKREGLFESLWGRTRAMIGLEPRRGEFWRARNEALLDAGMGLGEYTYLFVLGYSSDLVSEREETERPVFEHEKVLLRVRQLLVETLRRQLAAVEAEPSSADNDAWVEKLAREVARLERAPERIPWMDGLPQQIEASLAPYRERLDELRCEVTLHLELIRNEKQGLSVSGH